MGGMPAMVCTTFPPGMAPSERLCVELLLTLYLQMPVACPVCGAPHDVCWPAAARASKAAGRKPLNISSYPVTLHERLQKSRLLTCSHKHCRKHQMPCITIEALFGGCTLAVANFILTLTCSPSPSGQAERAEAPSKLKSLRCYLIWATSARSSDGLELLVHLEHGPRGSLGCGRLEICSDQSAETLHRLSCLS